MNQEKSKSFLATLSKEDKFLYKILGNDKKTGLKVWWILKVFPQKLTIFEGLISKGNMKLSDYGDILESGFGTAVPDDVLEKHGFEKT